MPSIGPAAIKSKGIPFYIPILKWTSLNIKTSKMAGPIQAKV
jgi:hypothetical protein